MDQYMVKTGANTWDVYTLIDGRNLDGSAPVAPNAPVPSTMTFDSSGKLVQVSTPPATINNDLVLTGWVPGTVTNGVWTANGAGSSTITVSMANTNQFNADNARTIPAQKG